MEEGTSASAVPNNDSVDSDDSPVAKRQRIISKDEIIGLEFPDGRVCWCPRSTLTNASGSYFAARFGADAQVSAGAERPGEHGRIIYFVDRNGELFEKYILEYLRTGYPGRLPLFSEDPHLWRALRKEAQFYALDGLCHILHVTHTCEPNPDGRGTLHWVGTDKGKREEYRNPHATGAVYVGGWADDIKNSEQSLPVFENAVFPYQAHSEISRSALVEYRPPVFGLTEPNPTNVGTLFAANACYNLWCGYSFHRIPTVVDLKTISVRLTNYSLRYNACGMTHWNLEGAVDGTAWDVLHKARDDPHLRRPGPNDVERLRRTMTDGISDGRISDTVASDILLGYVEREHRHTWTIDPPTTTFYRFFRIIGVGEVHDGLPCLHGVGLELYGDIHEE